MAEGGGSGPQEYEVVVTDCICVFPPPGNAGTDWVVNCVTGFFDVMTTVVIGGEGELASDEAAGLSETAALLR